MSLQIIFTIELYVKLNYIYIECVQIKIYIHIYIHIYIYIYIKAYVKLS